MSTQTINRKSETRSTRIPQPNRTRRSHRRCSPADSPRRPPARHAPVPETGPSRARPTNTMAKGELSNGPPRARTAAPASTSAFTTVTTMPNTRTATMAKVHAERKQTPKDPRSRSQRRHQKPDSRGVRLPRSSVGVAGSRPQIAPSELQPPRRSELRDHARRMRFNHPLREVRPGGPFHCDLTRAVRGASGVWFAWR